MAHTETSGTNRRDFLYIATGAVGAVGAASLVWPFISQLQPDQSVLALSTAEVDLSPIAEGQMVTVQWRGKPIFIFNRAPKVVETVRAVPMSQLIDPQPDQDRVKSGHDNFLIVVGICTHLGCVPIGNQGNYEGWFCPCHGSQYDASGRVRVGPAPLNLPVPPYTFTSDTKIVIG
ncbi:MAG: ubiquinol-cytochrome c reductase iron-sulfur subunit [Azorhizobium sp. 32-67-21]|nr:MAG: ubiquinol-cytochrome c reductase iron-sulfur subunit [Azorhizobium sp. 32-67-21]